MQTVIIWSQRTVVDLTKGEKLYGTNYDIWHRKIQYLSNKVEFLETIINAMKQPIEGNTGTINIMMKLTMIWSSVRNDIIGKFEHYPTTEE